MSILLKRNLLRYTFIVCFGITINAVVGQVAETAKRYVRVGSLQSHFSAYGSERAWNNSYYEGLIWPADYSYQDNSVIKRAWIATKDFTDPNGYFWGHYGIYFALDYTGISLFPVELKQITKFEPPKIYVNGIDLGAIYSNQIDSIDANQIPDRIIVNVVNTSMGLTMTRKIYVFSQQYHDNYFIKEFTFTNTGNTDGDDDIELENPLYDVMIGWGTRYSGGREGTWKIGDGQSWGKHSWVTKRGEDYIDHYTESITEADPIVDWIRCGFSWAGQSSKNNFNNIGGPDKTGNGRLTSPHHVGLAILHVDRSTTDNSDDPNQPAFLGWHAGDTYPGVGDLVPSNEPNMAKLYDMLSGIPYLGLGGTDRLDETVMGSVDGVDYLKHQSDPFEVHNDPGGTNVMITYGPFDIDHGESITIIEVEGISGLSRDKCELIGAKWKDGSAPYLLPDGSETDDKTIYKNSWVFTGKDSLLLTFSRAKRNYEMGFNIPQPPLPPPFFDVNSGGDRIYLSWEPSPSESDIDFGGYKIFRAVGKPDTVFQELTSVEPGVTNFEDLTALRGQPYYYYIVAFNDGSNNTSNVANPSGPLHSSRFYTRTTEPVYLKRKAGNNLKDIRVVPNPFHIAARDIQYVGDNDKIMFLNIPAKCVIKIFTERGDLVKTIVHSDGSGDESWNSITSSRQVVVSGVYVAHFQVTEDYFDQNTGNLLYGKGETAIRKFIVVR